MTLVCPNCAAVGKMPTTRKVELKSSTCFFHRCPNCDFRWSTFKYRSRVETQGKPSAVPAPAESRWFLLSVGIGSEADNSLRMLLSKDLRPTGVRYLDSHVTPDVSEALFQLANHSGCACRLQALLQAQLRILFNSLGVQE